MFVYPSYTDSELVVLLKEGDRKAFTEIYDRYWKKLFAIAYNRIAVESVCEDILHDVFTDIWVNRSIKKIEHLNAYLATAIKYAIFNYIRSVSKLDVLEDFSDFKMASNDPSIEVRIDQRMDLERVNQEIDRLPDKCRVIFKYSRLDHLNNSDIAQRLGISIRTVENQLSNATRRLKKHFKYLSIIILFCA